ncbi:MAG: hypothetical protein J0665_19730 [Deltaproteobacteria bacterium]|nr:hypothetical protein [Deltaproteobacteria bacterium]
MAQFDVYETSNPESSRLFPFLLNVQADIDPFETTTKITCIPVHLFAVVLSLFHNSGDSRWQL